MFTRSSRLLTVALLSAASFAFIYSSAPQRAGAQWRGLIDPSSSGTISPYFLNPKVGFAYPSNVRRMGKQIYSGYQGTGLHKTTDGAMSWTTISYFRDVSVTDLCFYSLKDGYASTSNVDIGIAKTSDGGTTWHSATSFGTGFSAVYATSRAVVATRMDGDLMISHNGGSTWSIVRTSPPTAQGGLTYTYVTGNLDHYIYAIASDTYYDIFLVYSVDDGYTWNSAALDRSYGGNSVQLFAVPHSTEVIRQHLDAYDVDNDTYSFFSGVAPYASWAPNLQRRETGGWISGTACVQYLPNAASHTGLYRSTNLGATWKIVGGPNCTEIDDGDWENVSVVGYGAMVYAIDAYGGDFMVTSTGGDNTLSSDQFAPRPACSIASPLPIVTSLCDSGRFVIELRNPSCSVARFKSMSISGLPDSLFNTSIHDHVVDEQMPDSILITLRPSNDLSPRDVSVHLVDDEYVDYDTVLHLTFAAGATNSIAMAINTPAIQVVTGRDIDIPLYARPLEGSVPSSMLAATFTLRHDLFTPVSFVPTWRGVLNHVETFGGDSARVDATLDPTLPLRVSTEIGYLHCMTRMTDSNQSLITLRNVTGATTDGSCLSVFGEDSLIATYNMDCSQEILQKFLRGEFQIVDLDRVSLDPGTHNLSVDLRNAQSSSYSASIYTVTGERVAVQEWSGVHADIDINRLCSGAYRLSVRRSDWNAPAVTVSFAVVR